MRPRLAGWTAIAGGATLLAALIFLAIQPGAAQGGPVRVAFQIVTGSISGTYFPVGQMIAGLVSHPPGIGRCEAAGVCGPPGLIVSARASEGSIANVFAVNSRRADSGLAQADVVALAVAGAGPFKAAGATRDLRVIANLYPESVHLVAAAKAGIASVEGLRGKRVSLSTESSGTIATARAVLSAYRLTEKRIKPNYDTADRAARLLEKGELDAFFFVGGAPVRLIEDLIARGLATLVPIDGKGRERLLADQNFLVADTILAGAYPGLGGVDTVSVGALWIVNARASDDLVYAIAKALYNPANRVLLDAAHAKGGLIRIARATEGVSAPFHPGATKFYREVGALPPLPVPVPKP